MMIRLPIGVAGPGRGFTAEYQDNSHPTVTQVISSSVDRIDPADGIGDPMICHVRWTHVYFSVDGGQALVIMGNEVGLYRHMEYAASACLN